MANPYASVVILTMGVPFTVLECLKTQTFQDFEVIMAREKGIVPAMNAALLKAKGEIFVRLDDDVEMPATWLEELIKPFRNDCVVGATGPTFIPKELRKNRDSIRWAESPNFFLRWLYDNGKFSPGDIRECGCVSYDSNFEERFDAITKSIVWQPDYLEGTNWAMRTDMIRKVGGFDEKFDGVAEWFDVDCEKKILKKTKLFTIYNPKAYLYHLLGKGGHFNERFEGFGRIKNFLRFHWRHGRWRFLNIKFYVYVLVWLGYFIGKRFKWLK